MLFVYLGSMVFGGVLVGVSALGGDVDADVDVDIDVDADVDADADADADSDHGFADAALAWLPFASMRFWTFMLAFGGLTGSLLTGFGIVESGLAIALASGGVGYVTGTAMTRVVNALKSKKVTSGIDAGDYVGASAVVLLPVKSSAPGQVQLALRGRVVARAAESEEESLDIGETVSVLEVREDGVLVVTGRDIAN